jgi:hypothetical protein
VRVLLVGEHGEIFPLVSSAYSSASITFRSKALFAASCFANRVCIVKLPRAIVTTRVFRKSVRANSFALNSPSFPLNCINCGTVQYARVNCRTIWFSRM